MIDDVVYYTTKYGNLMRRKGNMDKQRFTEDPAFEASRKTSSEFGRTGKASALIRRAVKECNITAGTGTTHARLSKVFGEILRMDTTHPAGERQVLPEHLMALKGFAWDENFPIEKLVRAPYTVDKDATGVFTLTFPRFMAVTGLRRPEGATHAVLIAVGLALDFENAAYTSAAVKSSFLRQGGPSEDLVLSGQVGMLRGAAFIVGMGVEFYQKVEEEMVPLKEGRAFGIVG
jgi:hypothetical protein